MNHSNQNDARVAVLVGIVDVIIGIVGTLTAVWLGSLIHEPPVAGLVMVESLMLIGCIVWGFILIGIGVYNPVKKGLS